MQRMETVTKAIEVHNLTKRYGDFTAVDGINFDVAKGEIFGFLGPNGAGKTTTINMLTGLARRSVPPFFTRSFFGYQNSAAAFTGDHFFTPVDFHNYLRENPHVTTTTGVLFNAHKHSWTMGSEVAVVIGEKVSGDK